MSSSRVGVVAVVVAGLTFAASACDSAPRSSADATTIPAPSPSSTASRPRPPVSAEDFPRQKFSHPTTIDNRWSPLRPGMRFVYVGSANDGARRKTRRMVYTVTDLTKMIGDVRTVVLWVTDFDNGQLAEAELAFRAQDDDGNIWHMGEYPEEYEGGRFVKAPAWISGLAGARAGIAMDASPRLGNPDYAQGFAPEPINWADRSRVHQVREHICVAAGCYNDVLVMEEFEVDLPGAAQLKHYATGVGLVKVGWVGAKEEEREVLELTQARQLSATELADARVQALALERRAYKVSKDVYGRTPPSE